MVKLTKDQLKQKRSTGLKAKLAAQVGGKPVPYSRQVILPNGATLYSKSELNKLSKAAKEKITLPTKKAEEKQGETRWIRSEVLGIAKKNKKHFVPTKLRKSITPGTVLIILAGQHAGKRVVFLKQMRSGLLLVTGPYKLNFVPLKRIDQKLVIATSTKVDISGVELSDELNDKLFKKTRTNPKKQKEFLSTEQTKEGSTKAKRELTAEEKENLEKRKALQEKIDEQILPGVEKVEYLSGFLKSTFSLKPGQYPHELKF